MKQAFLAVTLISAALAVLAATPTGSDEEDNGTANGAPAQGTAVAQPAVPARGGYPAVPRFPPYPWSSPVYPGTTQGRASGQPSRPVSPHWPAHGYQRPAQAQTAPVTAPGAAAASSSLPASGAASAQDELQDQLDASQKALHGLRQELQQIRDLLQHAGIALDHAHAGQQLSVAERDRFMEQLATASAERDRFREELDRVTAELDSASGKAAEMIAGLEQEKATVKRVTALLAQRQELVRSLSGERDELRGELARRDEKLLQLQDRIRNMDDANGALQRQLAERDAQIVALDTRIDAADGALDTARSEMTESRRQIGDIRAQYQTCEEQLAKLNAELEQQGSTAGQQAAAVATGEKLQAELTACQAELDQAQAGRVTAQQLSNPQTSAAAPGSVATALADADGDGTSDETDLCPGTAAGVATGPAGCALDAPVTLKGVNFHYDSHELTSESHAVLDRVASILRHHPVLRLEVAGHTDTQGDPVYNLWLSQQRATTVRDYLIQQQVNPDNLTAQGYGSQQPVADNTTREGLARNRRVELRRLP